MRLLLSVLLLCTAAALPAAADEARTASLTPKEAADGWILLFDGETTFGWSAASGAKWAVFQGMLYPEADSAGPLVTTTEFAEFELQCDFMVREDSKAQVLFGCDATGRRPNGSDFGRLASINPRGAGSWNHLVLTRAGDRVAYSARSFSLLGEIGRSRSEMTDKVERGHIALAGTGVAFRNIKLRPLGARPLFNGKDLTGWKEFPGKKSKFTVTDKGELHLQDGPGDLQTEGQWADFILQLDCKSNGEHLNSGVFVRCIPDQYQQGYEAQIRNQFTAEPAQEYTVDEYDPTTHELKEKRKVKSPAVDYGTGGIYRRMPARREVAKDHEWFTMTVAASGRHLAVWVNGFPVADWTDNRPIQDNARNGCRLEKGAISLQGHDATTDFDFRSIRIVELLAAEKKGPDGSR
jgi:hypothetical protein